MKIKFLLAFLILYSFEVHSQVELKSIRKILPHSLNPSGEIFQLKNRTSSVDTFHLLAVMVDFAVDQDAATYGNGKFGSHYSKDYGKFIIDPLPHNRNYFKAHLEFLKNYYKNVSDGRVIIEFEVLDKIVSLPNVMSFIHLHLNQMIYQSSELYLRMSGKKLILFIRIKISPNMMCSQFFMQVWEEIL